MTDNKDDILVSRFFAEHKSEIADNGFSRRVMNGLPSRAGHIGRLWRIFCLVAGVLFFILNRGWDILAGCLKGMMADIVTHNVFSINPVILLLSLLILFIIAGYNYVVTDR